MEIDILPKTSASQAIPDSPLFVAEVNDPAFDLQGWLVIHSFASRGACGGIRIYPDVTRRETELLARAMTYKYSFHEKALGGAKAALRLPFDLSGADRTNALAKFGEHIAPLVKSRIYWPWTDMNCSSDDIAAVYKGAAVKLTSPPGNSAYYTALSTFAALSATAEHHQIPPEKCKITIEGLGSVGKYLAAEIDRWGGKLIGASTRIAAVANLDGIDAKDITNAINEHGDYWVRQNGNWDKITKHQLFSLPMHIHIPCARVHSVTATIAADLDCLALVPAANVPCTPEAQLKLNEKGISLLPSFVVNSGGVIAPGLAQLGSGDHEIRSLFATDFKQMIARLLKLSDTSGTDACTLASLESRRGFRELHLGDHKKPSRKRGLLNSIKRRLQSRKEPLLKNKLDETRRILRKRFS